MLPRDALRLKISFLSFCSVQKRVFMFRQPTTGFSSSGLDFPLSLLLPYPVRLPPLYFPSVSDRWFEEGRGGGLRRLLRCRLLKGDTSKRESHRLLEPADSEPVVAVISVHEDVTIVEVQVARAVVRLWVSTRRPIVAVANVV